VFLDVTLRRNPRLAEAAADLVAAGRVPAGCYVVDVDAVAANAARIAAAAHAHELVCLQMTKQFGRNPLVAAAVAAAGIPDVVAVELAEARVLRASGRRIGHLGHLVQVPRRDLAEALALAPAHITAFGVEQAAAIADAAQAAGVVQPLLLRVVRDGDRFFAAQRGGVRLERVVEAARAITRLPGVRLDGVTSFPCLVFDEEAGRIVAAPNLATLVEARAALAAAGIDAPVLNAPGASCCASLAVAAAAGATHVEPGSALIGNTPLHAVAEEPELPAMVYATEITHHLDGIVYTLGGGFYARGRARSALAFCGSGRVRAEVVPLPAEEIDYYGALRLERGARSAVGDPVVYAFRSQAFVTRAPVAVVAGIAAGEARVLGVHGRDGLPLVRPAEQETACRPTR
jgi:predicted amino acid racemase